MRNILAENSGWVGVSAAANMRNLSITSSSSSITGSVRNGVKGCEWWQFYISCHGFRLESSRPVVVSCVLSMQSAMVLNTKAVRLYTKIAKESSTCDSILYLCARNTFGTKFNHALG